jgi:hypothetical protein
VEEARGIMIPLSTAVMIALGIGIGVALSMAKIVGWGWWPLWIALAISAVEIWAA